MDYKERYKDWRNLSISQLSITNNVLITISIGYLAFVFDKQNIAQIHINIHSEFNPKSLWYSIAITSALISVLYGISVMFSRHYDFRVSRHLVNG